MATILVVDDEPLIAMALEAALEDAGHVVLTASNGRQALDRLAEPPRPDLILLDLMMPVMNGIAMLAAMGEAPDLLDLPVIVLSSLPEEMLAARARPVAGFLRKPYTADEILRLVDRVLARAA